VSVLIDGRTLPKNIPGSKQLDLIWVTNWNIDIKWLMVDLRGFCKNVFTGGLKMSLRK
jgi:hypothetical protein